MYNLGTVRNEYDGSCFVVLYDLSNHFLFAVFFDSFDGKIEQFDYFPPNLDDAFTYLYACYGKGCGWSYAASDFS